MITIDGRNCQEMMFYLETKPFQRKLFFQTQEALEFVHRILTCGAHNSTQFSPNLRTMALLLSWIFVDRTRPVLLVKSYDNQLCLICWTLKGVKANIFKSYLQRHAYFELSFHFVWTTWIDFPFKLINHSQLYADLQFFCLLCQLL